VVVATAAQAEPSIQPAQMTEDIRQWRRPNGVAEEDEAAPIQADAEEQGPTEDGPAPTGEIDSSADPESAVPASNTTTDLDDPGSADSVTTPSTPSSEDGDPDFSEFVQRIEEAAARKRVEQTGRAIIPAPRPATQTRPSTQAGQRGRRPGQQPARAARQQTPFFRRKRTWLVLLAAIPLIAAVIAGLYVADVLRVSFLAYNQIHEDPVTERVRWSVNPEGTPVPVPTEQAAAVLPDWGSDEPINIVLLGVDKREADTDDLDPPRSDTTIVVHINPATKKVAMMSIPRDLLVFIPGFGEDKMNAAYPLGEVNADEIPGGGPTLVAQTIEANFNIPIHYYATINFEGFVEIVDTVGGVIVDVDSQLSDNLYPTEDLRVTRVYFPTGPQKLDGKNALRYVRTRHGDSDIARGTRQLQVLMALREQAIDLDLVARAQELIEEVGDTLRTDLDYTQMAALANLGRQIETDSIIRVNLWSEGALTEHYPEYDGDAYYLLADWPLIHQLQAEPFDISPPSETTDESTGGTATLDPTYDVSIVVENATEFDLVAGNATQMLVDAGFTTVWPTDADQVVDTSVIENYTGDPTTAYAIADVLGLPRSAVVEGTGGDGIRVILGGDIPADLRPPSDTEETDPSIVE
jgi:LCP family protein required for cell wall assembly